MKKITAKEIALSGMAAALAVISVVLSLYIEPATLVFYGLASVALTLPLFAGSGRGSILAYVASAALSFLLVGYLHFLPYALMFGPYTILFYYVRKYLKKRLFYLPIEIAFANGSFFACFFLSSLTFADFPILDRFPTYAKFLFLALGLTLLFLLFDYAFEKLYRMLEYRFADRFQKTR